MRILSKLTDIAMRIDENERQTLISFFSKIILTAAGFFSTVFFAHTLGAALLGEYWIFLAYFAVFSIICDGGVSSAAVKKISEGEDESDEYFTASVILRIILTLATVAGLIVLSPVFVDFSSTGLMPYLIAALLVSGVFTTVSSAVYAKGDVGISQIAGLFNEISRIIFQVIFVFAGFMTGGLAAGLIAGFTAGILANTRYLKVSIKKFKRRHITGILAFSGWTFLSSAVMSITAYAGTILVGYFMKSSDAGIYTTALMLTSAVTFSSAALLTALYPKIIKWHANGEFACIKNAMGRIFTYSLLPAVPAVSGGALLGRELLYYLYGADFTGGYFALVFLFIAQLAQVFFAAYIMAVNAAGQPRLAFRAAFVQSAVVVPLYLVLIPLFGICGAGIAVMSANIAAAFVSYIYAGNYTTIEYQKSQLSNIFLSAILMSAFLFAAKSVFVPQSWLHVLLLVFFSAVFYFAVLLKTDRNILRDLKKLFFDIGIKI